MYQYVVNKRVIILIFIYIDKKNYITEKEIVKIDLSQHFIKRPYYVTKYNLFLFVCFWRNLSL